ncbi:MAG: VWA domain-containing protein [Phycisphaerales bacterium]|nr:VWA domain-containing protein [Phycisphaerales bacterium]
MSKQANGRKTVLCAMALGIAMSAGGVHGQVIADAPAAQPAVQPQIDVLMPQRSIGVNQAVVISAVDVDVRLTDSLATTTIAITVQNNGTARSQARVVLPVPEGSGIRTFGIDGIGDEPTAELLPRAEATQRYNEIVRRMVDPGLLEFVGNAMIQSSVFPVDPGATRVMTIVYEQTLDAHRGRVEYVLPRSAGYGSQGIGWSLDIELESSGKMGPVFSPSHPIVSKPTSEKSMRVGVPMLDEPGAFRLYAVLGSGETATTLLYPDSMDASSGYFMFVADVPEPKMDRAMLPREVTIVIDRSGSMGGEKIEQARESAKQIIRGMRRGERVRIVDYSDDVRSFADGSVEISDESIPQLIGYIDSIQSRGGTNLHDALVEAVSAEAAPGHLSMVLFLTDGLATVGVTDEASIRKAAAEHNGAERRVFTFGVGYDVNAPLLDGLAMDTRAESTFVLPGEDVEVKVGQVFDKLEGPVMIDPVLSMIAGDGSGLVPELTLVEPRELGDLYAGSRLVLLGRYHDLGSTPVSMVVQTMKSGFDPAVRLGGGSIMSRFTRDDATVRHAFISRLWAQRRIDSLINEIRMAGADGSEPNQELIDEIVRLSLEHGIMTEYTAFLAHEELGIEVARERDSNGDSFAYRVAMDEITTLNSQRSGAAGVAQASNRKDMEAQTLQGQVDSDADGIYIGGVVQAQTVTKSNSYLDTSMERVRIQSVQRGVGSTMYKKQGRWVDARLGDQAGDEPEVTIAFGDEAYWDLVDDLVAQGRQWILANRGDLYFMNHSKRVLVQNPQ